MVFLELGEVGLFGTLPEWRTPATFQHLEFLIIGGCNITVLLHRLDDLVGMAITELHI